MNRLDRRHAHLVQRQVDGWRDQRKNIMDMGDIRFFARGNLLHPAVRAFGEQRTGKEGGFLRPVISRDLEVILSISNNFVTLLFKQ